jgi:hypothetical protein
MELNFQKSDYYGQVEEVNDKVVREGKGVMKYHSGRTYEGTWSEDRRTGEGYEMFENGNIYKGSFEKGRAHGKGVYTWHTGEVYEGEWVKGHKHGRGVWKGQSGEYFIGDWKRSKPHGYGMHIWKNQDRYEGEWKQGLKCGNGTDIFSNGDVYVGEYFEGKFNGRGKFVWHQGMIYEGEFKEGMRHGRGVWRESNLLNATSYDGMYFNDKKHGDGLYKWRSGSHYKGSFYNDQRDGYGDMFWIDASSYKGQWEKGAQKGEGIMTYPDGTIKKIVETSSRNYSITAGELYNSKSLSESDPKLSKHQRLISGVSSYSQDEMNHEAFILNSKKQKQNIKLINHNKALSTSNGKFRMERIDESIRESGKQRFDNFMKNRVSQHRKINSKDYPRIPPVNQVLNNFEYESGFDTQQSRKKSVGINKVLSSSHYNTEHRNKSFDMQREPRVQTGNYSSHPKIQAKYTKSHEITTEPEAIIKIIRRNRKKSNNKGKKFINFQNNYNCKFTFSKISVFNVKQIISTISMILTLNRPILQNEE